MRAGDFQGLKHRDSLSKQLSLWLSAMAELIPDVRLSNLAVSFFYTDGECVFTMSLNNALRRVVFDDPTLNIVSARYLVVHVTGTELLDLSKSSKRMLDDWLRDPIHATRPRLITKEGYTP